MNNPYNHFVCIVAGENPDNLMSKYDNSLKVSPYIAYKKKDCGKIRETQIKLIQKLSENENISDKERECFKNTLEVINEMTDEEFFETLTYDYSYDEEGNAVSDKNPNGKWDFYTIGKMFSYPFILKDGTTSFSAIKKDIDWDKIHKYNSHIYERVWEMLIEGDSPKNEDDMKFFENMQPYVRYLNSFKTKENYVLTQTSFWGYAFLDEKGWTELGYNESQFDWVKNFYDKFIINLPDNTKLTIVECKRES